VTTARRLHHSYQDYLAALEMSHVKLEYEGGEIYAMAGGTPAHADLAAACIRLLGNALLNRCRVSTSDLKGPHRSHGPLDVSGRHRRVRRA